jgi:hypothetical protein
VSVLLRGASQACPQNRSPQFCRLMPNTGITIPPVIKKGHLKRNSRLQIKLHQEVLGTNCNTGIAIFLAKNWLSIADRPEVQVITNVNISGPFVRPDGHAKDEIDY